MQDNQDNLNTAETPNETAPAPKKSRKWLTGAFNIASGMAVSLAVKTLVVTCAATVAAPTATVFIGAAAAGLATSYLRHTLENYQLGKAGEEKVKFTFKKAAMGAGFGMLGAGLIQGLDHFAPDLVSNAISSIKSFFGFGPAACIEAPAAAPVIADVQPVAAPVEPVAPVEAAAPTSPEAIQLAETAVTAPEPTSLDCAKLLAENPAVSDRVHDAIERTTATNVKTSAQGLKDLGFFLYNGLDGMPKDPCLAVKLLKEAAELGNVQAQVDLAYIEYHGNAAAGVVANPEAALEKMQGIKTGAARQFVAQWTGAGVSGESVVKAATKATAAVVAPTATLETVTIQPSQPVVTVDVTNPAAPSTTTAFTSATTAGATVEVGQGSGSALRADAPSAGGMDCQPVINVGGSNNIDYVCSMPVNDDTFSVGERVIIQRPGLLNLVR